MASHSQMGREDWDGHPLMASGRDQPPDTLIWDSPDGGRLFCCSHLPVVYISQRDGTRSPCMGCLLIYARFARLPRWFLP